MDDMYVRWLDGENIHVPREKDPFWDPVEDIFLGRYGHHWFDCNNDEKQLANAYIHLNLQ